MSDLKTLNFLVIDDDTSTREMLIGDLRDVGFTGKFYQADNGANGLKVLEENSNDIKFIICDIVMPIMTGMVFLENFIINTKYNTIPIMMLTSRSDMGTVLKCLEYGVSGYLIKPWNKQNLVIKITEGLKKHAEKKK